MLAKITSQPDSTRSWQSLPTKSLSLLLIVVFNSFLLKPALANSANGENSALEQNQSAASLHRLDFRLEGKSCATCLLSIQRKLNSLPGVKEAVVMLKRPYGVSVIYLSGQTKVDEILAIVKDKEPNVKVFEINDVRIGRMPALLIPPFVPVNTESQQ